MNKKLIICLCSFLLVFAICENLRAETVEETFKNAFPDADFDRILPTEIKGLYEVIKGPEIIYFAPDPGYLLVGDMFTKEGKNLTERRKEALFAESAKKLPLDKAIKIGSGKNTIIEFTDPDCEFCRTASRSLSQKQDLTRYIFFFPLPMHKDAEDKVKYIFCAKDRVKAYQDAMQGKLDDQKYEKCSKPAAAELLEQHKQVGQTMHINSTPFFIINFKKAIKGADMEEIEGALKN